MACSQCGKMSWASWDIYSSTKTNANNADANTIMLFFWRPNVTVTVNHQHSWPKRCSNQLTYTKLRWSEVRHKQCWWTNHMLDDILFSTQLLITHMVTIFSVDDNHGGILGIHVASRGPKQNKVSLCLVWWSVGSNRARNHAHFVFWNHFESTMTRHNGWP